MKLIRSLAIALVTSTLLVSCGGSVGGGMYYVKFKYGENSVSVGLDNIGWSSSGNRTTNSLDPKFEDANTTEEKAILRVMDINNELEAAEKPDVVVGKEYPVEFEQGSVVLDEGATCKITSVDVTNEEKGMFGIELKVKGTISGSVGGVAISESEFSAKMYDGKKEER